MAVWECKPDLGGMWNVPEVEYLGAVRTEEAGRAGKMGPAWGAGRASLHCACLFVC